MRAGAPLDRTSTHTRTYLQNLNIAIRANARAHGLRNWRQGLHAKGGVPSQWVYNPILWQGVVAVVWLSKCNSGLRCHCTIVILAIVHLCTQATQTCNTHAAAWPVYTYATFIGHIVKAKLDRRPHDVLFKRVMHNLWSLRSPQRPLPALLFGYFAAQQRTVNAHNMQP
jgi:hypothetical protein